MSSDRRMVSFRIPTDLLESLDDCAAERRIPRSQLIVELLKDAMNNVRTDSAPALSPRKVPSKTNASVSTSDESLLLVTGSGESGSTEIAGMMTVREFAESGLPLDRLPDGDQRLHKARIADLRGSLL